MYRTYFSYQNNLMSPESFVFKLSLFVCQVSTLLPEVDADRAEVDTDDSDEIQHL